MKKTVPCAHIRRGKRDAVAIRCMLHFIVMVLYAALLLYAVLHRAKVLKHNLSISIILLYNIADVFDTL